MTPNISFEMLVTHVCDAWIDPDENLFDICLVAYKFEPVWGNHKYHVVYERFMV